MWTLNFPFPILHPSTPHWCSFAGCAPAHNMHFASLSPQFPWRSWLITQHFIHTDPGPAFQYFSTFLIAPPNRRPLAIIRYASISLLTVIKIAGPRSLLFSCCSQSRFLLISHRGIALNGMPVEDLTSLFKSFIFPGPRYRSNDILCTFRRCHCSRTSTPITASSIVFAAWINIFDCWGNSIVASAFSVSRAEIDSDGAYFTRVNRIFGSIPAFY